MPIGYSEVSVKEGETKLRKVVFIDEHIMDKITQQTGEGGISVTAIWAYAYQYPIAKIENATYEEVKNVLNDTNGDFLKELADKTEPSSSDITYINSLRNLLPKSFFDNV